MLKPYEMRVVKVRPFVSYIVIEGATVACVITNYSNKTILPFGSASFFKKIPLIIFRSRGTTADLLSTAVSSLTVQGNFIHAKHAINGYFEGDCNFPFAP